MAHTPGPWRIDGLEIMDSEEILSEPICELSYAGDWKANARLIAAAPDLLEACEAVLSLAGDLDLPDNGNLSGAAITDMVRAAIARAKGEA